MANRRNKSERRKKRKSAGTKRRAYRRRSALRNSADLFREVITQTMAATMKGTGE